MGPADTDRMAVLTTYSSSLRPRPRLQVLIASTRPGRAGEPTGRWISQIALEHGGFDVEVVDLAEVGLPMFAEPEHPSRSDYRLASTRAFSATVQRADAFAFVMPEYNHGYNAALKNALDHLFHEWRDKPVALVSYGGVAGGARAAMALEPVLIALGMRVTGFVPIPFIETLIHQDGAHPSFRPTEAVERSARKALDGLAAAVLPRIPSAR